jgi:hypothetical protein
MTEPLLAPAVAETVAEPTPTVIVPIVGADGRPMGITALLGADAALDKSDVGPLATTEKVYVTPVVSPPITQLIGAPA